MNNLDAIYDFILNELRKLALNENFYFKPIKPKLSDLELIAINISAEYLSLDSEYQLFRYLSNSKLKGMIERSVYNRRKRKLFLHMENIRKIMVDRFHDIESIFIVDSMPLEICKNARANRSKICKEDEFSFPSKGYCASQSSYYYGYKFTLYVLFQEYFKVLIFLLQAFMISIFCKTFFIQFVNVFVFNKKMNKIKVSLI
ncbi:MAG: hypothetical protein KA289_00545 [Kaistella sp.]|nr:hypothetical protein [Kaistella sp.]